MCLVIKCEGVFGTVDFGLLVGNKKFFIQTNRVLSSVRRYPYTLRIQSLPLIGDAVEAIEISAPITTQEVEFDLRVRGKCKGTLYTVTEMPLGIHVSSFPEKKKELKICVEGDTMPVVFMLPDVLMCGKDVVVKRVFILSPQSVIRDFVTDDTWEEYKERYRQFKDAAEREA